MNNIIKTTNSPLKNNKLAKRKTEKSKKYFFLEFFLFERYCDRLWFSRRDPLKIYVNSTIKIIVEIMPYILLQKHVVNIILQ